MPSEAELFDLFRARFAERYGADHPRIDEESVERVRLYLGSLSPEVQDFVASFPALSEPQRAVLGVLLEP